MKLLPSQAMLATVCLLFGAVPSYAQDSVRAWGDACGLGLVPNEYRVTFARDSEEAFRASYCGEWYQSHQEEIEGSGGVKILVVKVSADGSRRTEEVTREQYCGSRDYRTASMEKWEVWSKTVSDDARRDFFKCVANAARQAGPNSPVVLGTMEETSRGLVASLRWDRNVSSTQPRFQSMSTVNLTCTNPYAPGKKISHSPQPINCTWQNAAIDGQITVEIEHGGGAARSYERQFTRLGSVSLTMRRDEEYVSGTNKAYGTQLETIDMHEKGCIDENAGGIFGDLIRQQLVVLRRSYGAEFKPACFGKGGFVYPFSVTASDKARLKLPLDVGLDPVRDNDRAFEWNAPHPVTIISGSTTGVRFTKGLGSRSIVVKAWATQELVDTRPIRRPLSWDLLYDGFKFTFQQLLGERPESFTVEWADHSSEPVTLGSSSSRLRLVSKSTSDESAANGGVVTFTYAVALGANPPAFLKNIGDATKLTVGARE